MDKKFNAIIKEVADKIHTFERINAYKAKLLVEPIEVNFTEK